MDDSQIADVRAFNRFYTGQIGLLDEHIVDSPFSLTEARVLYEIAARGHTTGSELARVLGLDRAYLSRILQKFLGLELMAMAPIPSDRRQNQLALTREGDEAAAALGAGSDRAVHAMLEPLDPGQRHALVEAMRTIRRLLGDGPADAETVVVRPHRIGELGWLVHRQGLLYNQQYGWNGEFEALIARIYNEYATAPETPPKNLWIAERNGAVAGSIFVMPSEGIENSAQLRMLYVEPAARGLGIGRTLVDQCVRFARESGYERMRLWTHSVQVAARTLYAAAGFEMVETSKHHNFGKDLESEIWELKL